MPMFAVALQLPAAPLLYWLTSGLFSLGQHFALRSPAVRYGVLLIGSAFYNAALLVCRPMRFQRFCGCLNEHRLCSYTLDCSILRAAQLLKLN